MSEGGSVPASPVAAGSAATRGSGSRCADLFRRPLRKPLIRRLGLWEIRFSHQVLVYGRPLAATYNVFARPLFVVPERCKARRVMVAIVDHPAFDLVVGLTIVVNCIALGLQDPSLEASGVHGTAYAIDSVCIGIFFLEFALKVVTMGLVMHRGAYLRSGWNVVDGVVVVVGVYELAGFGMQLGALRLLRAARPLRHLRRMRGTAVLLNSMLRGLPRLMDILALLSFVLWVVAILGVQFWRGSLHQRCFLADANRTTPLTLVLNDTLLCSPTEDFGRACSPDTNGVVLPQICAVDKAQYEAPLLNFDHVGRALLLAFRVVSLDGWGADMSKVQQTSGWGAGFFFVVVTMVGHYFLLNLAIAVLVMAVREAKECGVQAEHSAMKLTAAQLCPVGLSSCLHAPFSVAFPVATLLDVRPAKNYAAARALRPLADDHPSDTVADPSGESLLHVRLTSQRVLDKLFYSVHTRRRARGEMSRPLGSPRLAIPTGAEGHHIHKAGGEAAGFRLLLRGTADGKAWLQLVSADGRPALRKAVGLQLAGLRADGKVLYSQGASGDLPRPRLLLDRCVEAEKIDLDLSVAPTAVCTEDQITDSSSGSTVSSVRTGWKSWGVPAVRKVVDSLAFGLVFYSVTVLNVAVLAVDHYGIDADLEATLDDINFGCSLAFIVEAAAKMVGLGPYMYFTDGYNAFDFVLVLIGMPELFLSTGGSALSVFRALRIARVARLVAHSSSLRHHAEATVKSVIEVGHLTCLLAIFVFAFGILGLQLFWHYRGEGDVDRGSLPGHRASFKNLGMAVLTVFIVVTGDGWGMLMESAIDAHGWFSWIYFTVIFVSGHYLIKSLYIAVLIQNFSQTATAERASAVQHGGGGSRGWSDDESTAAESDDDDVSQAMRSQRFSVSVVAGRLGRAEPDARADDPTRTAELLLEQTVQLLGPLLPRTGVGFGFPDRVNILHKRKLLPVLETAHLSVTGAYSVVRDGGWLLDDGKAARQLLTHVGLGWVTRSPRALARLPAGEGLEQEVRLRVRSGWFTPARTVVMRAHRAGRSSWLTAAIEGLATATITRLEYDAGADGLNFPDSGILLLERDPLPQLAEELAALRSLAKAVGVPEDIPDSVGAEPAVQARAAQIRDHTEHAKRAFGMLSVHHRAETGRALVGMRARYLGNTITVTSRGRSALVRVHRAAGQDEIDQLVRNALGMPEGSEVVLADGTRVTSVHGGEVVCPDATDPPARPVVPLLSLRQKHTEPFALQERAGGGSELVDAAGTVQLFCEASVHSLEGDSIPDCDECWSRCSQDCREAGGMEADSNSSISDWGRGTDIPMSPSEASVSMSEPPPGPSTPGCLSGSLAGLLSPADGRRRVSSVLLEEADDRESLPKEPAAGTAAWHYVAQVKATDAERMRQVKRTTTSMWQQMKLCDLRSAAARAVSAQHPDPRAAATSADDDGGGDLHLLSSTLAGEALGCLGPLNPIRVSCHRLVSNSRFQKCVTGTIILSCVFISLDSPDLRSSSRPYAKVLIQVFDISDNIFLALFCVELVLKVLAHGVFGGDLVPVAYLLDWRNFVDMVVVFTGLASVVWSNVDTLRACRSVRALRLVLFIKEVKMCIVALINALPEMLNVVLLSFLVWFVFAILGVQFFKGRMHSCSDRSVLDEANCVGTFLETVQLANSTVLVNATRVWRWEDHSFDNVGLAVLALWELSLGDRWTEVIFKAMDTTGKHTAVRPGSNHSWQSVFFFAAFAVISQFFLVNLILGVLMCQFARMSRKQLGLDMMNYSERHWVISQRMLLRAHLRPIASEPEQRWRRPFHHVAVSATYDAAMAAVIVLNSVAMATAYDGMDSVHVTALETLNIVIVSVFCLEVFVKMVGLSPSCYFSSNWNRFDFFATCAGLLGIATGSPGSFATLRIFRLGRLLRHLTATWGAEILLRTFLASLPGLLSVATLFVVVLYIFGVFAVTLFGHIRHTGNLDSYTNFDNIAMAIVTLYRVATTDGWILTMRACSVSAPDCTPGEDCGDEPTARVFFMLFMVVASFLILNLFVIIMVDNYANVCEGIKHASRLNCFAGLIQKWLSLDPRATGLITAQQCVDFIRTLPAPLWHPQPMYTPRGRAIHTLFTHTQSELNRMHIPVNRQFKVRYEEVVCGLVMRVFGVRPEKAFEVSERVGREMLVPLTRTEFSLNHFHAARHIESHFLVLLASRAERRLRVEYEQKEKGYETALRRAQQSETVCLRVLQQQQEEIEKLRSAAPKQEQQQQQPPPPEASVRSSSGSSALSCAAGSLAAESSSEHDCFVCAPASLSPSSSTSSLAASTQPPAVAAPAERSSPPAPSPTPPPPATERRRSTPGSLLPITQPRAYANGALLPAVHPRAHGMLLPPASQEAVPYGSPASPRHVS
eukprot:TRINITY_DN6287_c0_g2_i1.p1 TRINITY_DN6287_c0_g2~~TRINITY_DN6287_c0_g2_i1.p1  ORF type:complete len:2404 (+),score=817.22 TRINITY_DN6287_c0_g2_i1:66-7214(+)